MCFSPAGLQSQLMTEDPLHVPESPGQPTQQALFDCRKHTAPVLAVVPHDAACAAEDFGCMGNKVEGSLK